MRIQEPRDAPGPQTCGHCPTRQEIVSDPGIIISSHLTLTAIAGCSFPAIDNRELDQGAKPRPGLCVRMSLQQREPFVLPRACASVSGKAEMYDRTQASALRLPGGQFVPVTSATCFSITLSFKSLLMCARACGLWPDGHLESRETLPPSCLAHFLFVCYSS